MKKNKISTLKYILPTLIFILPLIHSCGSKELMTKPLFMQIKRINLEMPKTEGTEVDEATGAVILTESVTYRHQDNNSETLQNDTAKTDLSKVQKLSEVVVEAKTRFAPEREGRVDVDFVVRVPKELISEYSRLIISPKLLHNDSVVPLQNLVLKGQDFLDKQKQDYADYEAYVNSIVNKSDYDDMFLDRKGITQDIHRRQSYNWKEYHKQWAKLMSYQKWRTMMGDRYAYNNIRQEGNRTNLYNSKMRDKEEEVMRYQIIGKDTTGLEQKYLGKFNRRANLLPQYNLHRELTEKKVPKKFREFYSTDMQPEDLMVYMMTEKDSIQIAKYRYRFEAIVENEMKDKRKDEKFKEIVTYPYETNARLDSIITNEKDFVFYYKQDYPVEAGLKHLKVTMDSRVSAVDKSGFNLPKSDTLSYFISSLAQLADTTLMVKKTKVYRNMVDRKTIYPKFAPNSTDFDIAYKDNREQIDILMDAYELYTGEAYNLQIDSIEMSSSTALNGSYDNNAQLSEKRVFAIKDYLATNYPSQMDYGERLRTSHKGEDWNALVSLLKPRTDIANKDEILNMLATAVYPDNTENDMKSKYKADFKIIQDSIYPLLNKIDLTINLRRDGMEVNDSIKVEKRDNYQLGLQLLSYREYWKAWEILSEYPDYNAAVALACLGYNGKAYDFLMKLPINGNTEYLKAILCVRLNKEEEAVAYLLKACELDSSKVYRAAIDTETAMLIRKYNLTNRLENENIQTEDTLSESDEEEVEDELSSDNQN